MALCYCLVEPLFLREVVSLPGQTTVNYDVVAVVVAWDLSTSCTLMFEHLSLMNDTEVALLLIGGLVALCIRQGQRSCFPFTPLQDGLGLHVSKMKTWWPSEPSTTSIVACRYSSGGEISRKVLFSWSSRRKCPLTYWILLELALLRSGWIMSSTTTGGLASGTSPPCRLWSGTRCTLETRQKRPNDVLLRCHERLPHRIGTVR